MKAFAQQIIDGFAPFSLLLGDAKFDQQTAYIFGAAVIFALGLIPSIDIVWKRIKGEPPPPAPPAVPQPFVVTPQPVFATMEIVSNVDKELKASVAKLEKYVHDSVHEQGKAIQHVITKIEDANESHREAIQDVNQQGEERITKVHNRLNTMVEDMGGLKADSKHVTQRLVAMQQTLEVLLGRTQAPAQRRGVTQG